MPNLNKDQVWIAFILASYVVGHLVFLFGHFLDLIYDRTYREYKRRDDKLLSYAKKMKARSLGFDKDILNAYHWADHFVRLRSPAASTEIDSLEAESKFFRGLTIVLLLVAVFFGYHYSWELQVRYLDLSFLGPWAVLLVYMVLSSKIEARIRDWVSNGSWTTGPVFWATLFYFLAILLSNWTEETSVIYPITTTVANVLHISCCRVFQVILFAGVLAFLLWAVVAIVNLITFRKSGSKEKRIKVRRYWHAAEVTVFFVTFIHAGVALMCESHFRVLALCLFLLGPSFWRYSQLRWKCTCFLYQYAAALDELATSRPGSK